MAVEITGSLIQSGSMAEFSGGLDIKENQYDFGGSVTATLHGTYNIEELTGLELTNPDIPSGGSSIQENVLNYSLGKPNGNDVIGWWEVEHASAPYPNNITLLASASNGDVTDINLSVYDVSIMGWKNVATTSSKYVDIPGGTIGNGQPVGTTQNYIFMCWGSDFDNKKTGIRHTIVKFTRSS
tara:strand:+ start:743 stop:1291 length:549 start_codon:yes stop_codon:yes gene_type:complete